MTEVAHRGVRYDRPFVLVVLDVDGFKALNDAHGRLAGDIALQAIGDVLRRTPRRSDTAFRLGGDEFAVILAEPGESEPTQVIDRIGAGIAAVEAGAGTILRASFGVALANTTPNPETLPRAADAAMYESSARATACASRPPRPIRRPSSRSASSRRTSRRCGPKGFARGRRRPGQGDAVVARVIQVRQRGRDPRMNRNNRIIALLASSVLALGVSSAPALAAMSAGELVSGTTLGTLALTGSAASFGTTLAPGTTATASGLLTATNTAASSTLTVGDAGRAPATWSRPPVAAPTATPS